MRTVRQVMWTAPALLALAACHDDTSSPTAPAGQTPSLSAAATTSPIFRQISVGGGHGCGVTTDYRVYCWGYNTSGELGIGNTAEQIVKSPAAVMTEIRFRSVSAGHGFTCGVAVSTALYCWGQNQYGQLGNGTTATVTPFPVRVQTAIRIREVSAGVHHACAVSVGDIVYCWGRNDFGQVGDGTTTERLVPVRPLGWAHFRTVSTGDDYACGVIAVSSATSPRRAYCWGAVGVNAGRYGTQTVSGKTLRPRAVPGGVDFDSVQSGMTHVCGITPLQQAYCWGADKGFLGSAPGGSDFQITPRQVAGQYAFRSVDAGTYWSCGVTTRNVGLCWGVRSIGVGDGTPGGSPVPVQVGGQLRFRAVSTGGQFSCGLAVDGKVYCWGDVSLYGPTPTLITDGA